MNEEELIKAIKGECGVPLGIATAIAEKRQISFEAGCMKVFAEVNKRFDRIEELLKK